MTERVPAWMVAVHQDGLSVMSRWMEMSAPFKADSIPLPRAVLVTVWVMVRVTNRSSPRGTNGCCVSFPQVTFRTLLKLKTGPAVVVEKTVSSTPPSTNPVTIPAFIFLYFFFILHIPLKKYTSLIRFRYPFFYWIILLKNRLVQR